MTLTVIGPLASRTFRVLWALEELGLDYLHRKDAPWSDEVRALNPLKQVPILIDGEDTLTDSTAIMRHLAHREGRLLPEPGSIAAARADARINFLLTELEVPLWLAGRHSYVLPTELRHPAAEEIGRADFARAEKKFARLLGEAEFFGGDEFGVADIIAGHLWRWSSRQEWPTADGAFADYGRRITARPAVERMLARAA